ncbi:hypothetical protein ECPA4_2438, partial [Escherichia coli PA4]
MTIVRH